MSDRIQIQRSLSGLYWAVTLDGDRAHPLYQDSSKANCQEQAVEYLSLLNKTGEHHG